MEPCPTLPRQYIYSKVPTYSLYNEADNRIGLIAITQEAIVGPVEIFIGFVARNGKLRSAFCEYYENNDGDLFIRGNAHVLTPQFASCMDLDKITPAVSIVRRIIEKAGYNGIGCINLKLVQRDRSDYLQAVDPRPHFTTEYDNQPAYILRGFDMLKKEDLGDASQATPKYFEINPRVCAPISQRPEVFRRFIEEYYLAWAGQ